MLDTSIPANDLFGTPDPRAQAEAMEGFTSALQDSFEKSAKGLGPQRFGPGANPAISPDRALEFLSKSVDAETLASVSAQVQAALGGQADLVKDFTLTSPLSTGYVPYDLEAPAKFLAPRPTPLRNKLPRKPGQGTAIRYKRITGITGSGTGGVSDIHPGIADTSQANFANSGSSNALYYNRGSKITYAGDEASVAFQQFSLSDQVPWSAQYAGQGFQDIRSLSAASLLYASMLMEEKMLLFGRGTGSGFSGALSAPTASLAARAKAGAEVGLSGVTTNVYVFVTAESGSFGESVLSTVANVAATNGSQVVDVTITAGATAGGTGYRVYVGTGAAQPANSAFWLAGRTGSGVFTIDGALPTSGKAASTVTADTSGYANGYDGIIPILNSTASGYRKNANAVFSTSSPGTEFQTAFSSLYDAVKANPDEILMYGGDRVQLSDAIKINTANNYRLTVQQDELGGIVIGDVVTNIQNEVTGKVVGLTVHPWMPQGNAAIMSYSLPIPDSNVSDIWSVYNVQDYMGINWPVDQFAFESSSYWFGTFVCQAAAWNGIINGIKKV